MHIAIEGLDGVGKTTVAKLLASRIGFRVVEKPLQYLFDRPGENAQYVRYRDYINQQKDAHALRALFYGLGNVFLYHRFGGSDVITDRHLVSNYFWCGCPETEPLFQFLIATIGKPDLTVLLQASEEENRRRLRQRSENDPDIFKASLQPEALEKMTRFLKRYEMPYVEIDTTHLCAEEVVQRIFDALPETVKERIQGESS